MKAFDLTTIIAVLATSLISPMVLAFFTNRERRAEKKEEIKVRKLDKQEDWKREDAVRDKAEEAARLLLATDERVAKTAKETNSKLDQIHTLVNSNMTAAMRAELDATIRELAMMKEVVQLHKAAGRDASQDALTAIGATEHKIDELKATLDDRLRQTELADSALANKPG